MAPASLSSGAVPVKGARIAGIEAGATWRRAWVQAEGYAITLDGRQEFGRSPITAGGYVQASYTLIGTPRTSSSDVAGWGRPKPDGDRGAIEMGARFSYADVRGLVGQGGRQAVATVGLSWYPLAPIRVVLECGHARVNGGAAPRTVDFIATRAQLSF